MIKFMVKHGLAVVGVAGGLLYLSAGAARSQACPPQCPSGKVPLGIVLPVSGPPATFGLPTAKAIEIAVDQINATGGLLGVPVQLAIADDRCDAGMAAAVTKRHVEQDNVKFVIGPVCPAVAMDVAPIYAKAGVIQIVPAVTIVELTQKNFDSIFRIAATDRQEAEELGAYLARGVKYKSITVVYGDFFYQRAMAEFVKIALPASIRASAHFEPLQDVTGAAGRLADKLERERPDVIYLALGAEQFIDFVGALRARRVKSVLIGGQHMLSQGFWRATHAAAEGILVVAPIASLDDPQFRQASTLLRKADVVPDLIALYSYAAVQIWAEAVRRAGSGDRKQVLEALHSGEFSTAVGRVAFDAQGDRRNVQYTTLTWQGGNLIELHEPQTSTAKTARQAAPSSASAQAPKQAATAATEDDIQFGQPVPFGPFPVYGNTFQQLIQSVPLFPPIEVRDETLWKKTCSNCHQWDRQTLCKQGASYVANPGNVLRHQHPFGGPFKVALMRWSRGGCR